MILKSFNNRQGPKDLYSGVVGRRLRGRPKADHGEESDDSIRATGLKACGEGLLSGFNIIRATGRPPSGLNAVGAQLGGRNKEYQSRPGKSLRSKSIPSRQRAATNQSLEHNVDKAPIGCHGPCWAGSAPSKVRRTLNDFHAAS
jgi:hypothetical protein